MASSIELEALSALEAAPWFENGLRFSCTGCGVCCSGATGSVFLSSADVDRLREHLRVDEREFLTRFTRIVDGKRALSDRKGSSDCVFLDGKACGVYEARPAQCRAYPFWLVNMLEPEDWAATALDCEGIDHPEASLVPAEEVLESCREDLENEVLLEPGGQPSR